MALLHHTPLRLEDLSQLGFGALKRECIRLGLVPGSANTKEKLISLIHAHYNPPRSTQKGINASASQLFTHTASTGTVAATEPIPDIPPSVELPRDIWKMILLLVAPLPRLVRCKRVSKLFSELVSDIMESANGAKRDYMSVKTHWAEMKIASGSTPKSGGSITGDFESFGLENPWCIAVSWLHDWGALFEDWVTFYDLRTLKQLSSAERGGNRPKFAYRSAKIEVTDAQGICFRIARNAVNVVNKHNEIVNTFPYPSKWGEASKLSINRYGVLAVMVRDGGMTWPQASASVDDYKIYLF